MTDEKDLYAEAHFPVAMTMVRAVHERNATAVRAVLLDPATDLLALAVVLASLVPADVDVLAATAAVTGQPVTAIISGSRRPAATDARHVACAALRTLGLSLPAIGRIVRRDHTSVLHAIRRVSRDKELSDLVERVLARLGMVAEPEPQSAPEPEPEPVDEIGFTGRWVRDGLILRPVAS